MLHFLVTSDHSYTLHQYFAGWGAALRANVRIACYESRPWKSRPLPGTWIFTDIERLREDEAAAAGDLASRLEEDPARWRVLNNPRRVLLRHALMRELSGAGINRFRAFRLAEIPPDIRYPVFLRGENDHDGSVSGLLRDPAQLEAARRALPAENGVLAIEYVDCRRADGLIIKYSMMRIGDDVVPRHMFFSREWLLKNPDLLDAALLREEDRFVEEAPHREEIATVFRRAGIEYGRVDYSISNGGIQVFEINTNPILVLDAARIAAGRIGSQSVSANRMNEALGRLDAGLPVVGPREAQAQVRVDTRRRRVHRLLQRLRLKPGPRR